jgi:pyridoxine/pyridoxamine 5'-phosphate oxidase
MTGGASLQSIFAWVWNELSRATCEPKHPFRFPVISTTSTSHGSNARIVVLRRAEELTHSLEFYTDLRSEKIGELKSDPRITWVFWDPSIQVQLRIRSKVSIHSDDPLANDRWRTCPISSRVIFLTDWASGTSTGDEDSQPPPWWPGRMITGEESERGRPHFAVVRCALDYVDFYEIAAEGQRRARFQSINDRWSSGWMSP